MLTSKAIQLLVLFLLVLGVAFYSIFFGIEMMDSGFIVSLSERLSHGLVIYKDFDYVRPPLSVIMWYIILLPFYSSPYLFVIARCIVLLQFAIIAWNLVSCQKTNSEVRFQLWALYFVLGININPVMPWHTLDGIFFLSFALRYIFTGKYALAFFAALLAALCKQSFIFPAIVLGFYLLINYKNLLKTPLLHTVIPLFILGILVWYFNLFDAVQFYRPAEKSSLSEFYIAGISHYYNSFSIRIYFFIFLFSLILTFTVVKNNRIHRLAEIFLVTVLVYTFAVPAGKIMSNLLVGSSFGVVFNHSFADAMVPITALYMLVSRTLSFKFFFTLVIIWSASLSWGYNNILFALPFLLVLYQPLWLSRVVFIIPFIAIIAIARLFFTYGESEFITKRLNRITNVPAISGIYTDVKKNEYVKEATLITNQYKNFIFVNCNNFAPVMSSEYRNRAVWEYDTESPNYRKDLKLLRDKDMYFILDKSRIGKASFHKSTFETEVIRQKKKVFMTSNFIIYN